MTKKNWIKLLKTTLAASLTLPMLALHTPVSAEEEEVSSTSIGEVDAEAALLLDFETGQILYDKNADEQRGIASMTKMLVEYILFEEVEAGNITWETEVTISDYAYAVSQNYALSNVPLHLGGTYTVQELYEALAIYSANGATIALAEVMEGSEHAFVDRMRTLVESWGVEDYALYNTTGLNNSFLQGNHYPDSAEDAENTMSAKGIATVSKHLLEDYPQVLETSSIPRKVFREGTSDAISMMNWNWMLEGLSHERLDVDGLKTGTTEFAGATFTGTAEADGRRLISVVLGAGDGMSDKGQRFVETSKLLDYGFNEWTCETIIEEESALEDADALPVRNGLADEVSLKVLDSLSYYLPKDIDIDSITYTFVPNEDLLDTNGQIEAPVSEGDILGELVIEGNTDIQFLGGESQEAISVGAAEDIERAGGFTIFVTWIKDFFGGLKARF